MEVICSGKSNSEKDILSKARAVHSPLSLTNCERLVGLKSNFEKGESVLVSHNGSVQEVCLIEATVCS